MILWGDEWFALLSLIFPFIWLECFVKTEEGERYSLLKLV